VRRYEQVISVKREHAAAYERIHTQVWPEVLAIILVCNIRNYAIFRLQTLLFAYFEYVGENFAVDMVRMAADLQKREWWAITDPMQEPTSELPGNGACEYQKSFTPTERGSMDRALMEMMAC
jgi:L-rhamnose mutarotase